MALATWAYSMRPSSTWATWQAAAAQATRQHQAQLLEQAHQQGERTYLAWVQEHCGEEAWWRPRADGALVCTDKRGRSSTRVLVGAQP